MHNLDLTTLRKQGFIKQREGDYFTIRLKILAGNITADQMVGLSDVANKYGRDYVSLTTRLGVEIPWIKKENLEKVRDELEKIDLKPGGTGPTVRAIVACKGTVCAHGLINTQRFCSMLDAEYFGKVLPSKFKMGIAGCPNNCTKVQLNDIGFMGQCMPQLEESLCGGCLECLDCCPSCAIEKGDVKVRIDYAKCILCGKCITICPENAVSVNKQGVALFIGGKFGRKYRIGERVGPILSIQEAMAFTKIIIAFYEDNAKPGERFGETVNRIGIESIKVALMCLYDQRTT